VRDFNSITRICSEQSPVTLAINIAGRTLRDSTRILAFKFVFSSSQEESPNEIAKIHLVVVVVAIRDTRTTACSRHELGLRAPPSSYVTSAEW